ncbi:hypothetical protein KJ934_02935 [Patescibacteria group bacterium]|nr:hypothetical protein [Patescibacteria group bacterium]MBU4353501.1 hypothetical protein [Patescibacteria group bacterium]MBU4476999.1 hypothetical protein [Patescibacteria group bacterium]MCG2698830.1 hypothetical protein [Candidatus Parcubacteria bacterium]
MKEQFNLSNSLSKEELEKKFGGDSTEYPEEITEMQKELSEQLEKHYKWCEENGLDPKENEFFIDGHRYLNDNKEIRYAGNYISGKFKNKKILINPGESDRNHFSSFTKWHRPEIDIEGEERIVAENRYDNVYQQKAQEIFNSLAPYVAYDMRKIRLSNEEITHQDKWIKGKPERDAYEKAQRERKEKQEQGRHAVLEVLGINPSATSEEIKQKLTSIVEKIDIVEFPEKYEHGELRGDEISKTQAIINVLNKKREELLNVLGDNLSEMKLNVSEKVFPSSYEHRRASQNWSHIGPKSWDEYDVNQKMIEINGNINGKDVLLEATKLFTTGERSNTATNHDIASEFAEDLATRKSINSRYNTSYTKMNANVQEKNGDLKEFILLGRGYIMGYDNSPAEESEMIFKILFNLADYTKILEQKIEKIKAEQERAEKEREENEQKQAEKQKKEQELIKNMGDFFGGNK